MRPYPQRRPRPLRFIPPGVMVPWVSKNDFACCVAYRDAHGGRWAIGDCGTECERKAWRHEQFGTADTTNPQADSTDNPQAPKRTMGTISPHTEDDN